MPVLPFKKLVQEDCPRGDITSDAIFKNRRERVQGRVVAKSDLVLSGVALVKSLLRAEFPTIALKKTKSDGAMLRRGDVAFFIEGPVKEVLQAERLCLNLLQHLSGVATMTSAYVAIAKPYGVKVLDTRKTMPGYRDEQRLAVRHGGGHNHRQNLSDQYLIKENHIAVAGSVTAALLAAREHQKQLKTANRKPLIEIEVETKKQFIEALTLKPDIILLDNMAPQQVKVLVQLRNDARSKTKLEVSGGITLKTIARYVRLGIERVSIGALTHSVQAADLSLLLDD